MRIALPTLLLLGLGHACVGQGTAPADNKKIAMSFSGTPLPMPLIALASMMPSHRASLDDSLARRAHARNRVKTVALVRLDSDGGAHDTLDYAELDRAGYPVLTAKPMFGARTHLRYNRQHRLISATKDAEPGFALIVQADYDPASQTTTTRVGPTPATLALYQSGRYIKRAGVSSSEVLLTTVPGLPAPVVDRVLLTRTALGGDTARFDLLGYQSEQVVKAEAFYAIISAGRQREGGGIVLPAAGRATRALEGRFIPGQRNTFDAAGRLIRTQFLPAPQPLADKPITQTSADGKGSMTTKPSTDTLTTTYQRNADGQLLRETFSGMRWSQEEKVAPPQITTYTYLPNGLRRGKTDSHGARYEYCYTFY
jgi:hypothetical protein